MALAATAAHIEKIVRKYRQVERLQAADLAMALHDSRSVSYYWAEDGALVVQARLPPEQRAVLIEALQRADKWIETPIDEPREARRADALSLIAERCLAGEATEADRFQITVHVSAETLRDGVMDPEDPPAVDFRILTVSKSRHRRKTFPRKRRLTLRRQYRIRHRRRDQHPRLVRRPPRLRPHPLDIAT